jgi:hypothetical protein
MNNRRQVVAGLALTPFAVANIAQAQESTSRTLQGVNQATGVTGITLDAGRGAVTIRGADTDQIEWRVTLSPEATRPTFGRAVRDWFFRPAHATEAALIAAMQSKIDVIGDRLHIALRPPTSARSDRLHEEWTVRVPRALAASIEQQVGNLSVEGLEGGVRAVVGVGNITVNVPTGNVNAALDVGDIAIAYGTNALRMIRLASGVGRTSYSVGGLRANHQRAPGSGDNISINGNGQFEVRARVNVGDVNLEIG